MFALLVTIALLLGNAFFVGAEFAAISARRSQLEPLADAGSVRAKTALAGMEQMGSMLVCAQLGITVCSVLLGAFSEAALHHFLVPPLERVGVPETVAEVVALVLALLIVVYLHVVVGEMIPKNLALAGPDRAALVLVPPLLWLTRLVRPLSRVLEWIAKRFVRAMGIAPKDEVGDEFTAAEVQHIIEESYREGLVETDQLGLLGAALEFSDKDAGDVALPLEELVIAPSTVTPNQLEQYVAKYGFSRYPTRDDRGDLDGYLHLKDILDAVGDERDEPVLASRIRPLAIVAADDAVESVLRTMQSTGSHVARVMTGDGGVVGVVFLEDVIEELVGEVTDAEQR